jgi:toxin YoeB
MKLKLAFSARALGDLEAWATANPKIAAKIIRMMAEAASTPRSGTGKPERLVYAGREVWSRRITDRDRLVYEILDGGLEILSARFHYDDH